MVGWPAMGASKLPPEVIRVIEAAEVLWSDHAGENADDMDLYWEDVAHAARKATWWKREVDDKHEAIDGWKDSFEGRDCCGRKVYVAGKQVYFQGERHWYVVTIHEAR
ncbi:MAG: hypothetical protein HY814_09995 [Candidatus Riflebacteria bacterium]|nr:hypothetical protein [Candidatus Riflebacteria bacterium]